MSANPFPEKAIFHEMPDRAIMDANARRPVVTSHFFEIQRGVVDSLGLSERFRQILCQAVD